MISALLIVTTIAVTDGDTLRSGDLRIRLWGIDAPELKDAGGPEAKQALADLTNGQPLVCDVVDVGKYGRMIAKCRLPGGADLACEMVRTGHAVDWPKYSGGAYAGCKKDGARH